MTDRPVQDGKARLSETRARRASAGPLEGARLTLKEWLLSHEPRGDIPVPKRGALRLRAATPL